VTAPIASRPGRIVIIGAGPTGLGAAYRLAELGHENYVVLDRADGPGGLASSVVDDQGFTWDIGGHVQFSHYSYYDGVVDRALDGRWLTHERESWIWIRGRFVPYPFQSNLHRLDAPDCARAIAGLEHAAATRGGSGRPRTFDEWITRTFGEGLAELFMRPYNFKVWGYPLGEMNVEWMGERVAVPDVERIKRQVAEGRDDVSWGPNRTFRFPVEGGTGAIWTGVAAMLPADRLLYNADVVSIDADSRSLRLADGRELGYDVVISTMPLDWCARALSATTPEIDGAASALRYSSVHVIGIGLRGPKPETLGRKCWMYFPESNSPYYRVTVFSNYSPRNVPDDESWSLMAEVCESSAKPVDSGHLVSETIRAMREDELIPQHAAIVSRWHRREEHGYPTPFVGRGEVLRTLRRALEERAIFSRGRFGAWKYEVSNQDHSFMQGVEVVNRLLLGQAEVTIDDPDRANSGVFLSK
jgi:protoporphyrinogen oxidase